MQKWLVFDAMGVIFEVGDDTGELLIPFIKERKPEIREDRIHELYLAASLGRLSSKAFWQNVGLESWQEAEKEYLDSKLTLDRDFVKTAEKLAEKYNLAVLSNDVGEWSAYLRKKFDIDRLFKVVIISGDVGFRKPDPQIYWMLLEKTNASAEDCIFFDDRVKNLAAAREAGIEPVLFNRDRIDGAGFRTVDGFSDIPRLLGIIYR